MFKMYTVHQDYLYSGTVSHVSYIFVLLYCFTCILQFVVLVLYSESFMCDILIVNATHCCLKRKFFFLEHSSIQLQYIYCTYYSSQLCLYFLQFCTRLFHRCAGGYKIFMLNFTVSALLLHVESLGLSKTTGKTVGHNLKVATQSH